MWLVTGVTAKSIIAKLYENLQWWSIMPRRDQAMLTMLYKSKKYVCLGSPPLLTNEIHGSFGLNFAHVLRFTKYPKFHDCAIYKQLVYLTH